MIKSHNSSGSVLFKDKNTRIIHIELSSLEDKNYKGIKIGVDMSTKTYKIKGPWKINIE